MADEEHLKILRQGVEVWNRWREENPHTQPDFSKAALSKTDLSRMMLRAANFQWADLSEAVLAEADLSLALLQWTTLSKANLSTAILYQSNLYEANLSEANLSKANLRHANLRGAILARADLTGANLEGTDLIAAHFNNAILQDANLYGARLIHATLSGANFRGANLRLADIRLADLNEADMTSAKLAYTTFGDVDLGAVKGLDRVEHYAPSTIGIDTLYRSRGKLPEAFLRGAGVSDEIINYQKKIKTPQCPYTQEHLDQWIVTNQELSLTLNKRIAHLEKQRATYGSLHVPFHLEEDLEDAKKQLQDTLSKIAEWKQFKDLYY